MDIKPDSKPKMSCVDKCLPACNETFYNIGKIRKAQKISGTYKNVCMFSSNTFTVVSSATFPNQNNPNKTKLLRELIAEGFENLGDINYVRYNGNGLRINLYMALHNVLISFNLLNLLYLNNLQWKYKHAPSFLSGINYHAIQAWRAVYLGGFCLYCFLYLIRVSRMC